MIILLDNYSGLNEKIDIRLELYVYLNVYVKNNYEKITRYIIISI